MVDKSENFRWLIRLGFAARGLVYLLIGYLALGSAGGDTGPERAFGWLHDVPLGVPLLYLAALGLFGYALYRLSSPLFDIENHGSSGKGIAYRAGHAASGAAHLVLAWTALQFARSGGGSSSGGGAEEAAGSLLGFPFGALVLGAVGLGFLAAAVAQAKSAATGDFMKGIAYDAPQFVKPFGQGGYAARAVVFLVIGWSLVQSAWLASSAPVKTLGEAVSSLADDGPWYSLVAVGLMLFGGFSLLLARYRVVPDLRERDLKAALH